LSFKLTCIYIKQIRNLATNEQPLHKSRDVNVLHNEICHMYVIQLSTLSFIK